jgi:hypothetical protein
MTAAGQGLELYKFSTLIGYFVRYAPKLCSIRLRVPDVSDIESLTTGSTRKSAPRRF